MNKTAAARAALAAFGLIFVFSLWSFSPFSHPTAVSEVWASSTSSLLEESAHHAASEAYRKVDPKASIFSPLPVVIILIPLLGALMLLWLCRKDRQGQGIIVTLSSGLALATSFLMYSPVIQGKWTAATFGGAAAYRQGIFYTIPFLPTFSLNLTFRVDPAALMLVILSCLVWFWVAIFSQGYLAIEGQRLRYNVASLCALSATVGTFLAGDLFTLYIFYELILIFLYLMVIHREDEEALKSAKIYLYFGVFCGLLLLFGIFLFSYFTGTVDIQSAAEALDRMRYPALKYCLAALFLLGFGGKAGIFLEHIWMPSSYGSAPCLTAALSSGIMIEVGAYGIFRTVNMIFAPSSHLAEGSLAWITSAQLGYVLIFVGIVTMLLGAINALFSTQALQLLAYSSVSQMGYIVMGIGCAAYMGSSGAMGLAGALYHIINHALFKVGLFLSIGAVYFHTRELDIRKLGGLWRDLPIASLTFLISALAIAGFPPLNGFASKTMLHHAILEAYQHSVHFSPSHMPDFWLRIAEIVFIITAGGTFAYNMKLFSMVFLGSKKKGEKKPTYSSPLSMNIALFLFAAGIVLLGFFPNWLLENFIGPMLPYFGFDSHSHAYHMIYNPKAASFMRSALPLWYDPAQRSLLASSQVIHNLSSGSTAILLGGLVFLIFLAFGFSEKQLSPAWALTTYYQKVFFGFHALCHLIYTRVVAAAEKTISVLMVYLWIPEIKLELIVPKSPAQAKHGMFRVISKVDEHYAHSIDQTVRAKGMFGHISKIDQMYDHIFDKAKDIVAEDGIFDRISEVEEKFSTSIDRAAESRGLFSRATKADGQLSGAYDQVIFSRFFWGILARRDEFKAGLWKYFNLIENWYDRIVERTLFDILGSEDLSKIQLAGEDFASSWFLRLCKRASEIHTGDISHYISWIAIALTVIIGTLVGFLYIKTFFAMIVALSTIITFFGVLAAVITFFFKR